MNRLSVVIIAFNEEENISKCIESVREIADEVVVVDSFSTDSTCLLAELLGTKIIKHQFDGHIQQKNFAMAQASFEYILSLDADETLSEELKNSIAETKKNFDKDGYSMNRLNFFCSKPVKTCGWYPDTKIRLWKKDAGQWTGINPHDKFELIKGKTVGHLKGDILHNTYPTLESFLQQCEKFANISAQHLKGERIFYLFSKMLFSAPFKFIRNYFFKLGFADGGVGFIICYHQSREVYLKYFRAIKLKYS